MSNEPEASSKPNQIHQRSDGGRNQIIGQVYDGLIVYGNLTINAPGTPKEAESEPSQTLFPNPYKGLLAFHESDKNYYFGRSDEVRILWDQFDELHKIEGAVRLLPIYGPSGSGKSSLARAGLLPALGKQPIAGRDSARVAVMMPGNQPLHNLAVVLARIAANDPSPVRKTREFTDELVIANKQGEFDGLQRIASVLPDISTVPLIVLIDQFEEVYSQCKDTNEQNQFIANLLYAASDRSRYVSIIITFRSDFLGETHRHLNLNRLFSQEGFLVPTMDEEALREAITQPAKNAGYPFSAATVDLLIQETVGREGTLPLLQVALSRIWENLPDKEPAQTLREIDGVGGALVEEAERIYRHLKSENQAIARRIFLGLVQLGEGTRDTRRRVDISTLVAVQENPKTVQSVIQQFASQTARLITLSKDENNDVVIVEVTHEALLDHWSRLKNWLDSSRNDLRFQRRLEEAAQYWNVQGQPEGSLWRSPDLDLLKGFAQRASQNIANLQLTALQLEFYQASQTQKEKEIRAAERRIELEKKYARLIGFSSLTIAAFSITIAVGAWLFSGKLYEKQKTIEAVFLGANTTEVKDALPAVELSADKLQKKIDTLSEPAKPEIAIIHYTENEEQFRKLFAYYRNILTVASRLKAKNKNYQDKHTARAEEQLSNLLMKYRIPQLQLDLSSKNFGEYLEKRVIEFENQYSEGALRTTYEILMTNSGAGADLNKDGFIADKQEANQMPCDILKELERLWREATDRACGWYPLEGQYAYDKDCTQLTEERSTLYTSIFGYHTEDALARIKQCGIQPE